MSKWIMAVLLAASMSANAGGNSNNNGPTFERGDSTATSNSNNRNTNRANGGSSETYIDNSSVDNSYADYSTKERREAPGLAMHSGGDCTGQGLSLVAPGAGIALSQVSKECEKRKAIELAIEVFEDYEMAKRIFMDLEAVKNLDKKQTRADRYTWNEE